MRRYVVSITPFVRNQILTRAEEIAKDSIEYAFGWMARIESSMLAIGEMPTGFPIDPDASERTGKVLRKKVFERTYLIFFEINESAGTVEIIKVRHGAKSPGPGEA